MSFAEDKCKFWIEKRIYTPKGSGFEGFSSRFPQTHVYCVSDLLFYLSAVSRPQNSDISKVSWLNLAETPSKHNNWLKLDQVIIAVHLTVHTVFTNIINNYIFSHFQINSHRFLLLQCGSACFKDVICLEQVEHCQKETNNQSRTNEMWKSHLRIITFRDLFPIPAQLLLES